MTTAERIAKRDRELAAHALHLAAIAPVRFGKAQYLVTVPRRLVEDIRATCEAHGVDWRKLRETIKGGAR